MSRTGPAVAAALAAVLLASSLPGAGGPRAATAADAPKAPWELEVEQQQADQTARLEEARRRKSVPSLVQYYESRLSRAPSPLNRYLLGRAQYWAGDPAAALRNMELVLREDPSFYFARVRLAILSFERKDLDGAAREASAVLAARPDQAEAREVLTQVAVVRKDWAGALRLLNERLDRVPDDLRVRAMLVKVHLERRDLDAALREARFLRAREPDNPQFRQALAVVLVERGEVDAAATELELLARQRPGDLDVLDMLRRCYARKKDWARLQTTLERMVPHLPEDARKDVLAMIEELKKGPPDATAPAERRVEWADVFRAAKGADPKMRVRALQAVYEGAMRGAFAQLDGDLLRRVHPGVESDAEARAWVVRIHGTISPPEIPLLQIALYDDVPKVRALAAETLGDLGRPLAVVYLLPLLEVEGMDVFEYQSVRDALSRLVGFSDLPAGTTSVATPADVAASREAWRRWNFSAGSADVKQRAVDELLAAGRREPTPERYLYRFVMDPDFAVMSSAYRAMRDVVARGASSTNPVERKVFPQFPSVPDAEVTRASMRALQERVAAWWSVWVAERRASIQKGR